MSRTLLFWLLSLVVVGALASAVTAQVAGQGPRVLSGRDIGFRLEGTDAKGRPIGTLVVRLNGEWVAAVETVKRTPLATE